MTQASGDAPRRPAERAPGGDETASYILDLCRSLAEMAKRKDFQFLAHLLNMAALEAAEIQIRESSLRSREPVTPSARGGAS